MKLLPDDVVRSATSATLQKALRRPVKRHTARARSSRTLPHESRSTAIERELVRCLTADGVNVKDIVGALRQLREVAAEIRGLAKRRGRARGGGQSSKAKGRGAVQVTRQMILDQIPTLHEDDVFVKATSQGGCDLHLSEKAAQYFPYGIEVKGAEALNIWRALAQTAVNARRKNQPGILFFKRAHSPLYVAMTAKDFFHVRFQDSY